MLRFYLSFAIIFASLFSIQDGKTDPYKKNQALMASIIDDSIDQLSKRYGLIPIGTGGGEKEGKSWLKCVSFQLYKKITKDEARILMVEMVEIFLRNINKNKIIIPYLYNHPFTYKNLELSVFILDKDGSDIFHPHLGLISLTESGTVNFVSYEPGPMCDYATDIEEPYEETYKIVMKKQYPGNSVE